MATKAQMDAIVRAMTEQMATLQAELEKAQSERDAALSDVSSVRSGEMGGGKKGFVNKEGDVVSEDSAEKDKGGSSGGVENVQDTGAKGSGESGDKGDSGDSGKKGEDDSKDSIEETYRKIATEVCEKFSKRDSGDSNKQI